MNDLERKCHNFILQCYFGDMENPIDAAIDRAYVDMASHTLKGFAEHQYQEKWELRFEASSKIKKALDLLDAESDYTSWHCELCGKLQKVYTEKRLSYGQAQKRSQESHWNAGTTAKSGQYQSDMEPRFYERCLYRRSEVPGFRGTGSMFA